MSEIFCPNCGSKHTAKGKFCEYCGHDLESVIVQYKNDKLPVRYQAPVQKSGPVQQAPQYQQQSQERDYYDDRRHRRGDRGFFDVLLSILFFWMCCGPGCD